VSHDRAIGWNAERYARDARFVAELGAPLIQLLAPQPGERILDLGCGDGALTESLARCGCRVVGLDASEALAAAARDRGLDVRVGDAQQLPFAREFHAVFSNAAMHWMPNQHAVIAGVARALLPGGRFVAELGGDGNVAHVRAALHRAMTRRGYDPQTLDPWTFPEPDTMRVHLQRHGLEVLRLERFERPTRLPGSIEAWLRTFAAPFLSPLNRAECDAVIAEVARRTAPALRDADERWTLDYVRLRLLARLPGERHDPSTSYRDA